MSKNRHGPAFGGGRFGFTIKADDDTVSISRPVSREDIERVRRQLAEWESRRRLQEPA